MPILGSTAAGRYGSPIRVIAGVGRHTDLDDMDHLVLALLVRLRREDGQTLAEYAVVIAGIVVAAVATLTLLNHGISSELSSVTNDI
jgi:Flp pilus assembly pilin Flp